MGNILCERDVPASDTIYGDGELRALVRGNLEGLQPYLVVRPPHQGSAQPRLLEMRRTREVTIDWASIRGIGQGTQFADDIKRYFEAAWGWKSGEYLGPGSGSSAAVDQWIYPSKTDHWRAVRFDPNAGNKVPNTSSNEGAWVFEKVDKGSLVIAHPQRVFRLILKDGSAVKIDDFYRDKKSYESAWANDVRAVELLARDEAGANQKFTELEELDLSGPVILRVFRELDLRNSFVQSINEAINKIPAAITAESTPEDIDQLMAKYVREKLRAVDVGTAITRLQDQARDLGYYLCIEDNKQNTLPGPNMPQVLRKGDLYRIVPRRFYWTTTYLPEDKARILRSFGIRQNEWWRWSRVMYHEQVADWYERVPVDMDPWVERINKLTAAGYRCFKLRLTDNGYVADSGETLAQLMLRCDADEDFRVHCAIFFPVYQQTLTDGWVLAKYMVFKRPMRGITSIALPRLFFEESLSYRMAWQCGELGQLTQTINLAPGEKRKLTITKTFERETKSIRSIASLSEITQVDQSDFAAEVERTAQSEEEQSRQLAWNVKAEGGFAFFSASAGANGANSWSAKQFAKHVEKIARKASSNMQRKNKVEVSSTASSSSKAVDTETAEIIVSNINQGRTLNLHFHQVNNRFSGGVYLDDLKFVVYPGTEVLAGSGVLEPITYSMSDLESVVERFSSDEIPIGLLHPDDGKVAAFNAVCRVLRDEYAVTSIPPEKQVMVEGSASVLDLPDPSGSLGQASTTADIDARVKGVAEALRERSLLEEPITPHVLLLPSGGLYLETFLGTQPGTEPYAEEMRRQEIRMQAAKVYREWSAGALAESEARKNGSLPSPPVSSQPPAKVNRVVKLEGLGTARLHIVLELPLDAGPWRLRYVGDDQKEMDVAAVPARWEGGADISIQQEDWSNNVDPKTIVSRPRLVLRHTAGNGAIGF